MQTGLPMVEIPIPTYRSFLTALLAASGPMEPARAAMIVEQLLVADRADNVTHGAVRIQRYHAMFRSGDIRPTARWEPIQDAGSLLVVRGNFAPGQVVMTEVLGVAIDRARRNGAVVAGVADCGHIGQLGYYADIAARADCLNFFGASVPAAARTALFDSRGANGGTPPLACNAYWSDIDAVVGPDMALTAATEGDIAVCAAEGVPARGDWLRGGDGGPTTEAPRLYDGTAFLNPIGGVGPQALRGSVANFGFNMLAGLFSGGGLDGTRSFPKGANHVMMVLVDRARVWTQEALDANIRAYRQWLGRFGTFGGDEIRLPGERRARRLKERTDRVPVQRKVWDELVALGGKLDVSP